MFRKHSILWLYTLVFAGLSFSGALVKLEKANNLSSPFGCLSAEQVAARTKSLCRSVIPNIPHPLFYAERLTLSNTNGSPRRFWNLACQDETGNQLADFTWDADTGDIESIYTYPLSALQMEGAPLTPARAKAEACHWFRIVGVAKLEHTWHLRQSESETTCRVWFRGTRWICSVIMNAHFGNTWALVMRRSARS